MRRTSGLTLLEVMFAIVILAIAVIGLMSAAIGSTRASRDAWDQQAAAEDLAAAIETVQGTSYNNLWATWNEGATVALRNPHPLMNEKIVVNYVWYDSRTGPPTNWIEHGPVVNSGD